MITVGVERERGGQGIKYALDLCPQQSVGFEVVGGAGSLCVGPGFGEKLDNRKVVGAVDAGRVRVLLVQSAFIRNVCLGRARADWPEMIYNREMIFLLPVVF